MSMTDRGIGDNRAPDYAKMEQERLLSEYQGYPNTLAEIAEEAKALDEPIPDDENADATALRCGALIKRFRDLDRRIEETRVVEVEPHLRRKNAADALFNGWRKMIQGLTPQERRTNPGWIDKLQARINAHQDRKEAKERARLEAERRERERLARETEEKARKDREEAERLAREAEERRKAAERARKPETIEQKTQEAEQIGAFAGAADEKATVSQIAAEQARDQAQESRIASLAKPADIVRTRGVTESGAGVTLTKAKEKYAYVVDRTKLNFALLAPYFSDGDVEKALRAWARATNHSIQMEGAEVGERTKGVTR